MLLRKCMLTVWVSLFPLAVATVALDVFPEELGSPRHYSHVL